MTRVQRIREALLDFPIGYFEHVPLPEEPYVDHEPVPEPHWMLWVVMLYAGAAVLATLLLKGPPR